MRNHRCSADSNPIRKPPLINVGDNSQSNKRENYNNNKNKNKNNNNNNNRRKK